MSPSARLTLLRILPIIALVAVALLSQQLFGVDRLWAAVMGLVTALVLRIALAKAWLDR